MVGRRAVASSSSSEAGGSCSCAAMTRCARSGLSSIFQADSRFMMDTRTAPDLGFENAAFKQVSMYASSNLSSPHFPPRREPFQSTDGDALAKRGRSSILP